jgi:hypothetical protein
MRAKFQFLVLDLSLSCSRPVAPSVVTADMRACVTSTNEATKIKQATGDPNQEPLSSSTVQNQSCISLDFFTNPISLDFFLS